MESDHEGTLGWIMILKQKGRFYRQWKSVICLFRITQEFIYIWKNWLNWWETVSSWLFGRWKNLRWIEKMGDWHWSDIWRRGRSIPRWHQKVSSFNKKWEKKFFLIFQWEWQKNHKLWKRWVWWWAWHPQCYMETKSWSLQWKKKSRVCKTKMCECQNQRPVPYWASFLLLEQLSVTYFFNQTLYFWVLECLQ
jgi:hypothetical protein